MRTGVAIGCFLFAAACFLYGFVTEWHQSRAQGPVAIVATLPFAVAAAVFLSLGLFWLPGNVPWWAYPLTFFGSVLGLGWLIAKANGRFAQSSDA